MASKRATLCVDVFHDGVEQSQLQDWLDRWQDRLASCSENLGCGCCVDMYDIDAPIEALDELPAHFLCASEWSGDVTSLPPTLRQRLAGQWPFRLP